MMRRILSPLGFWMLVAVLARLAIVLIASHSAYSWIDPDGYLARARQLTAAAGGPWINALADREGLITPPLYAWSLSLGLRASLSPAVVLFAQALLASITVAATMALVAPLGKGRARFVACALAALAPGPLGAAPAFWSEHLYVPISMVSLALLIDATRRDRWTSAAMAGIGFGLAALTRSMPLYVVPLLALLMAWRTRRACGRAVLVVALFAATTVPYVAAASIQAGRLVLIENSAEFHWGFRHDAARADRAAPASVLPEIVSEARTEPLRFARDAAAHVHATFSPGPWTPATASQLPRPLMAALDLAGIVVLIGTVVLAPIGVVRARDRTAALVLATWVLAQIPLIALSATNATPRYRAPMEPALFALAAAALRTL